MKALSLWQPWATLIAINEKRIETRSWSTSYRGEIAIHASKRWTREQRDLVWESPFTETLRDLIRPVLTTRQSATINLPLGAVIAIATLNDVLPTERIVREEWFKTKCDYRGVPYWMPARYEQAFGNYAPGRYGFLLTNVRRLAWPVLCVGRQRLFNLPPDVERRVRLEVSS